MEGACANADMQDLNGRVVAEDSSQQHASSCEELKKKIEDLLTRCVQQGPSDLLIPNRKTWTNTTFSEKHGLQLNQNPSFLSFGRCSDVRKSRRFGLTVHLLSKIHGLLKSNRYCTKRELYYEDVKLYGRQSVVDSILDDISCMLGVQKIHLHVLTTSKGCIAGCLQFRDAEGNYVDCSETDQGLLIPNNINGITNIYSDAKVIVIVEKDAVFQTLLSSNITENLYPSIIITGKGFPDVNTRCMVHKLHDFLKIPVLALVDADPYGIEILCIYTYGSMSLSFDVNNLAVPSIRWLGVLPSDISSLKIPESSVMKLTEHDKKKASQLLKRPYMSIRADWRLQVEFLIKSEKKIEIESLNKIHRDFLANMYLPKKIEYGGWI